MKFKHLILKIASFVGFNAVGTVVDTFVLWLFSHFVFHSYGGIYIISPMISFECAVFTNFLSSFFFIWKGRIQGRSGKTFMGCFLIYNLTCVGGFLIKMGLLLLIEHFSGWNVVFCNLAALCVSGCFNFAMNEWVVFRKRNLPKEV
ncbi:MAG: GtrA family protein [Candidatus Cryptobacteroides sp.]